MILNYAACLGCSLCYGVATVLELIASKSQKRIDSINPLNLISLLRQMPYVGGILLDLAGWLLFIVASRNLPLFLCLSFVASSLIVSAVVARIFLQEKILKNDLAYMLLTIIAIILLSILAKPEVNHTANNYFKIILICGPIVCAVVSSSAIRIKDKHLSSIYLAILAGLTFGATGLVSRLLNFTHLQLNLGNIALILSLLCYGVLGATTLTASLQRGAINKVNSTLYASELILPSILGIVFLGDRVKQNLWPLMLLSFGLIIFTTTKIALDSQSKNSH